jgi:hypothetical protein
MKRIPLLTLAAILIYVLPGSTQTFTNSAAILGNNFNSGGCLGAADMDGDGLEDVIILTDGYNLRIAYQEAAGTFAVEDYGAVSNESQWGMCAGDVDHDGHKDILCGASYDGVHLLRISARGVFTQADLNNGSMFMQASNMADINNDGWLDAFACHDDGLSRTWGNDGTGNLTFNNALIDLDNYDFSDYIGTDHSGNYGSVWSDFDDDGDLDLMIAKCRQFVNDPYDPRRINQLWVNDGNGNFTEEAMARGLVEYNQCWTADFGDIDNDGDLDCLVTTHSSTLKIYENDGNGYFTNTTAAAGIGVSGFFLQAKMVDFDNDSFLDIIYSGGVHAYYHNDGDGTFSLAANTFPYANVMHSFTTGDLNNDGFLDVYASYGNSYVSPDYNNDDILWLNNGNNNNWVSFDLTGILSNLDAVGAKVKIYGDWGVQVREIRAGESYGTVHSFKCHFGLGNATQIESAEIIWPSGTVTSIELPAINMVHQISEAPCQLGGVAISPEGPLILCQGDIAALHAPEGYASYLWSNGLETQSIETYLPGSYSVVVFDEDGCAGVSFAVQVSLYETEVPFITVEGATTACENAAPLLSASAGVSWLWSNGATSQSIIPPSTGTYSVTVTDECGNTQSSANTVDIEIFASPPLPNVEDVVLIGPGQATFEGSSPTLSWYTNENDVLPVAAGSTYTTGMLNATTTFWVEDETQYGGELFSGGKASQSDGLYHNNSQNWLVFNALEDIILRRVKVFANGAGNRGIRVIDAFGNTVATGTFFIPNGESFVDLNFEIPAGTGYGLRCTSSNPQLWRDGPPSVLNYPYDIGGVVSIESSNIIGNNALAYYYFFYDWEVETQQFNCTGERIPVTAFVGVEGCTDASACNYNEVASVDDGSCDYACLCPADLNSDGFVSTDDLLILLAYYGCFQGNCIADINGDEAVNSNDLLAFLAAYGIPCPQ